MSERQNCFQSIWQAIWPLIWQANWPLIWSAIRPATWQAIWPLIGSAIRPVVWQAVWQAIRPAVWLIALQLVLCAATLSQASILGQFDKVYNGPGYIISPGSSAPGGHGYKSPYKKKRDAIDRRSPSQIVFQDYLSPEGFINTHHIEQHIHEIQQWQRDSFLAHCATQQQAPQPASQSSAAQPSVSQPAVQPAVQPSRSTTVLNCPHRFKNTNDPVYQNWRRKKLSFAADLIVQEFERALFLAQGLYLGAQPHSTSEHMATQLNQHPGAQKFLEALFQALELKAALKSETEDQGFSVPQISKHVKNLTSRVYIPTQGRPEALNLQAMAHGCRPSQPQLKPQEKKSAPGLASAGLASQPVGNCTNFFYGPRDLLKHPDPSLLHPRPSGFWRPTDIPSFDTRRYNGLLEPAFGTQVYAQIQDIEKPATPIDLHFDSPSSGGSTAKLNANYKGFKLKVKLTLPLPQKEQRTEASYSQLVAEFYRRTGEVRSEFVANSLAAALGFTVNPTFYKKQVRLFFKDDGFDPALVDAPEGMTQLKKTFLQVRDQRVQQMADKVYSRSLLDAEDGPLVWDYLAALSDVDVVRYGPERGRWFVRLHSVSLEFKGGRVHASRACPSKCLRPPWKGGVCTLRVGHFQKYTFGKYLKREHRAFLLFYIWLSDRDAKDANASVGFVSQADGALKLFYSADDMGGTLSSSFGKNKPNFFHYDMLRPLGRKVVGSAGTGPAEGDPEEAERAGVESGGIEFHTWKSFYTSPLFKHISWADAKWMARLMAQLSEQQIKTTFLTAHYPEVVAEFYTQKLLRRRDQLVQALGLHNSTTLSFGSQGVVSQSIEPQGVGDSSVDSQSVAFRGVEPQGVGGSSIDTQSTVFRGVEPQEVLVRADTSRIEDPATYAAPSCPQCFKNGELVELPPGVLADENWALSLQQRPATPVQSEAQRMSKKALFNFFSRIVGRYATMYTLGADWSLSELTGSLGTLVPARYVLENPFVDTQLASRRTVSSGARATLDETGAVAPFWVVDIYRLATRVGQNNLWKKFGFDRAMDWPDEDRWRYLGRRPQISANMIEMLEFIHVRPVGSRQKVYSLQDVVKVYNPKHIVGRPVGELKRRLVGGLEGGEFLVSSRYLMFRPGFRLRSYLWHPSFEIDVVPLIVNTRRLALYQQPQGKMLMHWTKGRRRSLHFGLDFELLFFELPVLRRRWSRDDQHQHTYAFDLQVPEEKQLVLKHLDRDRPHNIPAHYLLDRTQLRQKQNLWRTSFFGLNTHNSFQKTTDIRLYDGEEKLLKSLASSHKGGQKKRYSLKNFRVHTDLGALAVVDRLSGQVMLKLNLDVQKKHAQRQDYVRLRQFFRALMPWRLLQFDDRSVNYYLGEFKAHAKVLFTDAAVRGLFKAPRSPLQLCRRFAHYTRVVLLQDQDLPHDVQVDKFCHFALSVSLVGASGSTSGRTAEVVAGASSIEDVNALLRPHLASRNLSGRKPARVNLASPLWQAHRAQDSLLLRNTIIALQNFVFYFQRAQKKYQNFQLLWALKDPTVWRENQRVSVSKQGGADKQGLIDKQGEKQEEDVKGQKKLESRLVELSRQLSTALVKLFRATPLPGATHLALLSMAPPGSLWQVASVNSSNEAFPGQRRSLELRSGGGEARQNNQLQVGAEAEAEAEGSLLGGVGFAGDRADDWVGDKRASDKLVSDDLASELWRVADASQLVGAALTPGLRVLAPFFADGAWKAFIDSTPVGRDILNTLTPGVRQVFKSDTKP